MNNKTTKEKNGSNFSFETIADFDGHISSSIIGYKTLYDLIIPLASNYIVPGCNVVDLGCSSGELLRQLSYRYPKAKYMGFDKAIDNLWKDGGDNVEAYELDITSDDFVIPKAKLITSIFTLQFLPPEKREELLKKVSNALLPGGAFIIAEKVYCEGSKAQDHFTFAHYDLKGLNFNPDEILKKQRDIRTIMKPQKEEQIETELYSNIVSGFGDANPEVELFWASYQFRAWIVIR